MKLPLYNQEVKAIGEVELNDKIFAVKPNLHLLAEAVRVQLSNARKGLANTKNRGEVSGGGKKPWKQKGTGRARAGSNRSPLWRHGGVTFGPTSDRNWNLKLNQKARIKALFMSLSDKAKDGNLIIIDKITIEPKTKAFLKFQTNLTTNVKDIGKKQLLMLPTKDENLLRASRNVPGVSYIMAKSLNIKDVMTADTIVVLQDSLPLIEKTYLTALNKKN